MTCRKCKEHISSGDNYVRYAVRHTAHWNCFFGEDTPAEASLKFAKLSDYQQKKIPWKVAERLGLDRVVFEGYKR